MIRRAFKMKLYEGQKAEYIKRHNELPKEMIDAIHRCGGSNYSIFFDEETNILFGYIELESLEKWSTMKDTPACKAWWDFMESIMETNADNSPVSVDLEEVFHLD